MLEFLKKYRFHLSWMTIIAFLALFNLVGSPEAYGPTAMWQTRALHSLFSFLLSFPLVCASYFFFTLRNNFVKRVIAAFYATVIFVLSMALLISLKYFGDPGWSCFSYDLYAFSLGFDFLSLFMIALSAYTMLIAVCCVENTISDSGAFYALIFVIEFILFLTFSIKNAIGFYILFEAVLAPMFLIIGRWGSGSRRVLASYYFFFFTLLGSVSMLFALLYLAVNYGSFHHSIEINPTEYPNGIPSRMYIFGANHVYVGFMTWCLTSLTSYHQALIFGALFIAFAVKLPIFPFHLWLPEAHVEAPTAGSVILAGILLKLGGYGFIRFVPHFAVGVAELKPMIIALVLLSILYTSIVIFSQTDLKKIVAYFSIAHMGYVILGVLSHNTEGVSGAIYFMISHGLVSVALFVLVGFLYNRYKARHIGYYGGIADSMPVFTFFFFMFCLANAALPGTCGFIGEFTVLLGVSKDNWFVAGVASLSMVLNGIASLWFFARVCYFQPYTRARDGEDVPIEMVDLSPREFWLSVVLFTYVLVLGVFPFAALGLIESWCDFYLALWP